MYYAEKISEWLSELKYDDLPKDVIEKAKECVIDWVGVAVLGSFSEWSKILVEIVSEIGGKEESTVVRYGNKIPCPNAAMVNAVMALSFDFSDTYLQAESHPSCGIVSSALAMGERVGADGKDLITSVVAGYEVMCRVGDAFNRMPTASTAIRGFDPTGIIHPFGVVATAGKLMNLNAEQMADALGLAGGSMGGGLLEYLLDGDWTYRWNPGRAAHNGIINVLMAEKGYKGPHAVFEGHWDDKGRYGALKAYAEDLSNADKLVEGLGSEWRILEMGFKYYSCCHFIQGYNDAALRLMREKEIKPEDIEEITVFVPHMSLFLAKPREIKVRPPNLTVSQWSLPFCLAVVILDGHLMDPINQLSNERVKDEKVIDLAERINVIRDRSLDEIVREKAVLESPLKMKLKDGREFEASSKCKGFADNPLTEEEFLHKFRRNTEVLGEKKERLVELLKNLENEEVSELAELLSHGT
ncbi:MAG: MmgE/PrpD family protein [Candidatus Syntropharchaeia archaeon]